MAKGIQREYNMRVFKKVDEHGKVRLYSEDNGKVWALHGGDFCGDLTKDHELLIDVDDYSENFYN